MKKLILAATLAAGLGAALPAAAQSWNDYGRGDRFGSQERFGSQGRFGGQDRIEMQIERGVRNGSLSEREARSLTRELEQIQRLEWRYQRDGHVSQRERMVLNQRLADLNNRLRAERFDRDRGFGSGYGRGGFGGYR